ncbi:MAG: hypothetical protein PVF65_03505 [Sphingomonadales bacterium]
MDDFDVGGVFNEAVKNIEGQVTSHVTDVAPENWDGRERRLNIAAYNYWESVLDGRAFPSVADLNPDALHRFSPNAVLIDFTKSQEAPLLRYVGSELRKESGLDPTGQGPDAVPRGTVLSRLTDHYLEILANRAPVGFEAEFNHRDGQHVLYRGILMPFSDDGENINFIYGVVSWMHEGPVSTEVREDVLPLEDPIAGEDDLLALLERGREAAQRFHASDQSSRVALYETLDFAHIFACAAIKSPKAYAELLRETGLKVQERAPYTPIVKLVFGLRHDKTRVAEYATVLAHAEREAVVAGEFQSFLKRYDGGLKAIVAAERRARRGETAPMRGAELDLAIDIARNAEAKEIINLSDCEDEDEFVLILARRNFVRQDYEILGRDTCSKTQVQHAIRRFAKVDK